MPRSRGDAGRGPLLGTLELRAPDNIDNRLVGYWSSRAFSYGVMEATDIGFLSDGRSWSIVYDAHDLGVTRFRWSYPQPGLLELRAEWLVQGTLTPLRPTGVRHDAALWTIDTS